MFLKIIKINKLRFKKIYNLTMLYQFQQKLYPYRFLTPHQPGIPYNWHAHLGKKQQFHYHRPDIA